MVSGKPANRSARFASVANVQRIGGKAVVVQKDLLGACICKQREKQLLALHVLWRACNAEGGRTFPTGVQSRRACQPDGSALGTGFRSENAHQEQVSVRRKAVRNICPCGLTKRRCFLRQSQRRGICHFAHSSSW
jgi:hypothetical protein